jgi:subtilisin family serine protease
MKRLFCLLLFALIFTSSCVKEEGAVDNSHSSGDGNTSGGSSGGSSGGTSGGSTLEPDPLAAYAWHLENDGTVTSFSDSAGKPGEDIDVKDVHTSMNIQGRNVKIAVSDSGVDTFHPDLSGNAIEGAHRNYSFANSYQWRNANAYPSDGEAHGTAVTGLIAALGWNGIGSRGVAPKATYGAFRFIFDYPDSETDESYLAKTIDQMDGDFDIFNYSYGTDGRFFVSEDEEAQEAIEAGVLNLRDGKGAIYVQSAGNDYDESYEICDSDIDPTCLILVTGNTNSDESQASPYKIIVSATNALGVRSSYSTTGSGVWVSAPGGEYGYDEPAMISTDIHGCSSGNSYRYSVLKQYFNFGYHLLNPTCDYLNTMNGTSSAAPVTSGVIALMLEARPELTWRDVKHILANASDRIDFHPSDPILNILDHPKNLDISGYEYEHKWIKNAANYYFSNWYGFGRVNAKRAVQMAATYNLSTLGTFERTMNSSGGWHYDSGSITKLIPDEDSTGAEDKIWVGHNLVVESVQIQLSTDHEWPGDLAVHLVSPSGTESRLLNLNNGIFAYPLEPNTLLLSNAFYGEESLGYWTIRIYDGSSLFASGNLTNWKIMINGHRKSTDLAKPYPPTKIIMSPTGTSATASPLYSFSPSASHSSLLRYEVSIGTSEGATDVKNWTSIGLSTTGLQVTGLTLTSGVIYYLNIRAVSSAGTSTIQLDSWEASF